MPDTRSIPNHTRRANGHESIEAYILGLMLDGCCVGQIARKLRTDPVRVLVTYEALRSRGLA